MHLSLSDLVTCPRCGPSHGLVLLPVAVRDRRVVSGVLGCANCRERFDIAGGVADLRISGDGSGGATTDVAVEGAGGGTEADAAVRLGALLGLTEPRGPIAMAGPATSSAAALASLVEPAEVVVLGGGGEVDGAGREVTRVLAGGVIPFRGGSFGAVALTGSWSGLVTEGMRILRPTGRLLVEPATEESLSAAAAAHGVQVFRDGSTLVVVRRA